jgi:hypothetical protein
MSLANVFTLPSQIGRQPLRGFVGQPYGDVEVLDCVSDDGIQAEIWTMAVSTFSASEVLSATLSDADGYSYTIDVTNPSSGDTTSAASNFASYWNADPNTRGVTASSSSATITFTGPLGYVFTIAESESNLGTPSNSQNAASASPIEFGRALCQPLTSPTSETGNLKIFRPVASRFTAQVQTITVVSAASAVFSGWVEVKGLNSNARCTWGPVLHDTDTATTAAAIVAAVNTALDAHFGAGYSCLAANTSGAISFTADIAGIEFDAAIIADGSASATAAKVLTTGPSVATSLQRAFVGVSLRSASVSNTDPSEDDPAYQDGDVVAVAQSGRVSVAYTVTGTAPTPGAQVYVSVATGNPGALLVDRAANSIALPSQMLRWDLGERSDTLGSDAAGVGVVRINALNN